MCICISQSPEKSLLHCSEREEDFGFCVMVEEDLVICMENPISAKFSINVTLTLNSIAPLQ